MKYLVLFILLLNLNSKDLLSQCLPAAPSSSPCSGGNGSASNGVNINSGETYWYSGSATTWASGVNINGGTLRVCGNLTLSNISFNGGFIIVEDGGVLTINGGGSLFLNGNSSICVRGTLNLNKNLEMQNNNNTIWSIGVNAEFNVSGNININSSTSKVILDQANLTASSITIQSSSSLGAVCLNSGSCITLNGGSNSIVNNFTHAWTVDGSGNATVTYNGNAELNNDFSNNSNLIVCGNAGVTTSGGAGWGSATLASVPCSGCAIALPVDFLDFDVKVENDIIKTFWSTATEINNDYFSIQRSRNGIDFEQIGTVKGSGTVSSVSNYVFYDEYPYRKLSYYRLKQVDYNGAFTYSQIRSVYLDPLDIVNIYPNPAKGSINIMIGAPNDVRVNLYVIDVLGKKVIEDIKEVKKGHSNFNIDISELSSGIYLFKVETPNDYSVGKQFIVK
jgi:hypothetical protein